MATLAKLTPLILKWEGGFSDHPLDTGGPTMKGITLGTFASYRKSLGKPTPTVNDLKNISDDEWIAIFRQKYWNPFQADSFTSQAVANILVDWAWGSGTVTAIKQLQSLLGLTQDGVVGPKTITAINSYSSAVLFNRIWLARKDFFLSICQKNANQLVFLRGWLNRLYDIASYSFNFVEK